MLSTSPTKEADNRWLTRLPIVIPLIVALLSATVLSGLFSSEKTYQSQYAQLDEKRDNVMLLTGAALGVTAAVTFLPDDTCTPIAEELAEIAKGFGIVLGALMLEKYLLTILGFSFFALVVPVSCVLFALSRFSDPMSSRRHVLQNAALKFLIFGIVLYISVPASLLVSNKIDATYEESVEQAVGEAQEAIEVVEDATEEDVEPSEGLLSFLQNQLSNAQKTATTALEGVAEIPNWARDQLCRYIELFAVMIVTSVVIPIVVPVVIYLAFKALFGQQQLIAVSPSVSAAPPRALAAGMSQSTDASGTDDKGSDHDGIQP